MKQYPVINLGVLVDHLSLNPRGLDLWTDVLIIEWHIKTGFTIPRSDAHIVRILEMISSRRTLKWKTSGASHSSSASVMQDARFSMFL